jgi:hypothetical protein
MAALSDDVKVFVTQALACYDTPAQVIKDVKQQFGLEVSPQQLQAYNPATRNGSRMSPKLKAIFEATRKAFVDDVSTIPIANQAYRLRVLNRMLQKVEPSGNVVVAASLMEQAAKEMGGAFTNRRELTGKGGGPVEMKTNMQELSDEALLAIATGGGAGTADPEAVPR